MSPQYLAARQCLDLLKQCPFSSLKKLRLEIQFVQLIRLLLQDDLTGSEIGPCSRESFDGVYRRMVLIRHRCSRRDAINSVMEQVGGILEALTSRLSGKAGDTASAQH